VAPRGSALASVAAALAVAIVAFAAAHTIGSWVTNLLHAILPDEVKPVFAAVLFFGSIGVTYGLLYYNLKRMECLAAQYRQHYCKCK